MSIKIVRNSLLKSSISIGSIRKSVTSFTEGMKGAQKKASEIVEQTGEDNKFLRSLISKDKSFFRKRRESVRRKEREDEIEASTVGGSIKRQGSILGKSTRGFLGRILDFLGIVILGWMVTELPRMIKTAQTQIENTKEVINNLRQFTNVTGNILEGMGGMLNNALTTIRGYNFDEDRQSIKKAGDEIERGFESLNNDIIESFNVFNDPKQAYNNNSWTKFPDPNDGEESGQGEVQEDGESEEENITDGEKEEVKNQWWDVLDLFPNKKKEKDNKSEDGEKKDESGDEKGTFSEVKAKPTMGTPTRDADGNIDGYEKTFKGTVGFQDPDVGFGPNSNEPSQDEIDDAVKENKSQEAEFNMFNKGGEVKGIGGIDQIPAKLTKGEFVVQKHIAEKHKEFLSMFNSGKLSPRKAINQAKQSIDLDAFKASFNEKNIEEMMSGASTAMDQVGKLPFDKLGDFPIGEFTKDIEGITEKVSNFRPERKSKSTIMIRNSESTSGSSQPPVVTKSKKSGPSIVVNGSSVNSTIKTLQELESAFT